MKKSKASATVSSKKKLLRASIKANKAMKQIKDIGAKGALLGVPVYEFLYW